jgi:ATP-dependent helicase/nuclease subunit A
MSKNRATPEQMRASNPAASAWVMANAGSGKTHVLVDRVIRLMLDGASPQSILCITYTKAAAAEMGERLYKALAAWIPLDDDALGDALSRIGVQDVTVPLLARARQLFALAIEAPGGLKIQTIHAFCEKLLQLFPVESGLAPGFRIMDEGQKSVLLRETFDSVLLEDRFADSDAVDALFEDGALGTAEGFEKLAAQFLSGGAAHGQALDESRSLDEITAYLRAYCGFFADETEASLGDAIHAIDAKMYADAAETLATDRIPRQEITLGIVLGKIAKAGTLDARLDAFVEALFNKPNKDGLVTRRAQMFLKETEEAHPDLCARLTDDFAHRVTLIERHALMQKLDSTLALIALMRQVKAGFERRKQKLGRYDFDDLIIRTAALLHNTPATQWVLYKLDAGLSHILVDESQDTSPAQWKIISALAEEFFSGMGRDQNRRRTVFAVGDVKQSIYSFQGADTEGYHRARTDFIERSTAVSRPLDSVGLTISYRSVAAVLSVVDRVFDAKSPAALGLKQDGQDRGHESHRAGAPGLFELWEPMPSDPKIADEAWTLPLDHESQNSGRQKLARFIASTIKGWLGTRKLAATGKPVTAGDILILVQSRGAFFNSLITALRQAGVPVAGADRLRIGESLAVEDVLALLQVLVMPDDDLALACVLKSPLVPAPLDEAQLAALAVGRTGSLWAALLARGDVNAAQFAEDARFAEAAGVHALIARVLARSRRAMVARLGVEALDATDMLVEQAVAYEQDFGPSLAGFLHWFTARDIEVKRELEQGGGHVRLMTVHGAKGLQAPIVILPDTTRGPNGSREQKLLSVTLPQAGVPTLPFFDRKTRVQVPHVQGWKDAAKAIAAEERSRLLYVAMTRAQDELYVCGALDRGGKSVAKGSWYELITTALDMPGGRDGFRAVDIGHPAGAAQRFGQEPVPATALEESASQRALPAWLDQAVATAPVASKTATAEGRVFDRAAQARGVAVHRVLELYGEGRDVSAALLGKLGVDDALAARLKALTRRADTQAFFGPAARGEVTLRGALPTGDIVTGRVDRLVMDGDGIAILDFKTHGNPPPPGLIPPDISAQLNSYLALLGAAHPGLAVRAAVLWTQTGHLEWLENSAFTAS